MEPHSNSLMMTPPFDPMNQVRERIRSNKKYLIKICKEFSYIAFA
jgi:hypothetical protein